MAVTFDTLKFVKTLESAGLPTEQAEAISVAVRDSQASADVATKGDLRELRTELKADVRLLQWMLGILIAGVASLVLKAYF